MNNLGQPNRSQSFRRRQRQRIKKRIGYTAVVCLCALTAVAILFIVIGNIIGDKVQSNIDGRYESDTETQEVPHKAVLPVDAAFVPIIAENDLSARLSGTKNAGFDQVSLNLDENGGKLLYSSKIAVAHGKQSGDEGLRTPENIASLCSRYNLYSIGVTHFPELGSDDDLQKSLARGYHAARIAELFRGGFDEILVRYDGITVAEFEDLLMLSEEIHRLVPDCTLGVALSPEVLADEQNEQALDALWGSFDYFAVEVRSAEDEEFGEDTVREALGNILYPVLRYSVRVLLPTTDDAEALTAYKQIARTSGASGIQTVLQ